MKWIPGRNAIRMTIRETAEVQGEASRTGVPFETLAIKKAHTWADAHPREVEPPKHKLSDYILRVITGRPIGDGIALK